MTINDFGQRSLVTHTTGLKERIQEAEKEICMRKYRGLTKEGKWVYGNYIYLRHNDGRESHFIQIVDAKYYSSPPYNRGWSHDKFEVIPETVGQSTGLKEGGIDVYAADIIHIKDGDYSAIGIVEWKNKSGLWVWRATDTHDSMTVANNQTIPLWVILDKQYRYKGEIIGTIHQNPELMEQEK